MKKTIACYGSLRKGYYNHPGLGSSKKELGTSTVKGAMYMVGRSYPHLLKEDDAPEGKVTEHKVELYEVTDGVYQQIEAMELGAGYIPTEQEFVNESGEKVVATIFFTDPKMNPQNSLEWTESYDKAIPPAPASNYRGYSSY